LLYFNGPVLILLLVNVLLFALTALEMCRMKKVSKGGESRVHTPGQHDKDRLVIYVKLFLLMGITWIMEIISWAVGGSSSIWFITDIINALRGLMIFVICVCFNKNIRKALKERFFGVHIATNKVDKYNSMSNEPSANTGSTDSHHDY